MLLTSSRDAHHPEFLSRYSCGEYVPISREVLQVPFEQRQDRIDHVIIVGTQVETSLCVDLANIAGLNIPQSGSVGHFNILSPFVRVLSSFHIQEEVRRHCHGIW